MCLAPTSTVHFLTFRNMSSSKHILNNVSELPEATRLWLNTINAQEEIAEHCVHAIRAERQMTW